MTQMPRRTAPTVATIIATLLFALMTANSFAEVLYTKRDKVDVLEQAALNAKVVRQLEKGVAVEVINKSGTRYKVKIPGGAEGFISKLHLTSQKPATEDSRFKVFKRDDVGAGQQANVDSIRGLRQKTDQAAIQEGISPAVFVQLGRVEERAAKVTNKELDAFLAEGGIEAQ